MQNRTITGCEEDMPNHTSTGGDGILNPVRTITGVRAVYLRAREVQTRRHRATGQQAGVRGETRNLHHL